MRHESDLRVCAVSRIQSELSQKNEQDDETVAPLTGLTTQKSALWGLAFGLCCWFFLCNMALHAGKVH